MLIATMAIQVASAAAEVDPGEDFGGYVEELDRRERAEEAYEAKLSAHEEWRQATWGGFAVRQIQALARKLRPFFEVVGEALRETNGSGGEQRTPAQAFAYLAVRTVVILGCLVVLYIGAKVLEILLGGDIEVVEEVVVIHEHDTAEEAAKARAATTRGKRQKQKSS